MPLVFRTKTRVLDDAGDPASGAKMYVFQAGTTTPVTTYSDAALSSAQTHPIVSDSAGYFADPFVPGGSYKVRVTDASDVLLFELDNITVSDVDHTALGTTIAEADLASEVRTAIGLGSMATQAANSVAITGGSVSGITDLAIADGGTGASTASAARTNLGLAIGTDVLAYYSASDLRAYMSLATDDDVQFGEAIFRAASPIMQLIEDSAPTQRSVILHDTGDMTITTDDPVGASPTFNVALSDGGPDQVAFSASLADLELFSTTQTQIATGASAASLSSSIILDSDGLSISGAAANAGPVQGSIVTAYGVFSGGAGVQSGGAAAFYMSHTGGVSGFLTLSSGGGVYIGSNDGEVYARDSAGNETLLSPHSGWTDVTGGPSEDMAWGYWSTRDGKWIATDITRWGRLLEEMTGEALIFIGEDGVDGSQSYSGSGEVPALKARIEALEAAVTALQAAVDALSPL